MKNEQASVCDSRLNLICDLHLGLERQGPGSPEMTLKALSFVDNSNAISRVADLGCGTGGQTMVLAQNMTGNITGVDLCPAFIDLFNDNARKLNLQQRVNGIVGSMDNLPFEKGQFDLIWSEGAIANIGFEKGLNYWRDFLKTGGYVAVTYESWFSGERPAEIERFWVEAVPEINTIGRNISTLQKSGYNLVAAFTLPETCWTDNYLVPRAAAQKAFLEKHAGNKAAEALIADMEYEAELYSNSSLGLPGLLPKPVLFSGQQALDVRPVANYHDHRRKRDERSHRRRLPECD